jgi:hypothetical protein
MYSFRSLPAIIAKVEPTGTRAVFNVPITVTVLAVFEAIR